MGVDMRWERELSWRREMIEASQRARCTGRMKCGWAGEGDFSEKGSGRGPENEKMRN